MKNINLKTIRIDGGTQSRVKLDDAAVADYTQVLKDGGELPPVVVFFDGTDNWMADGFHRLQAYTGDKRASIPADVRAGSQRDAMLFSFGANGAHGLRRTNDDKRKAVSTMLADAEWSTLSDRQIAIHCVVTQPFVSGLRKPKVITVITHKAEKVIAEPVATGAANAQPARDKTHLAPAPAPPPPEDDGPDEAELADEAARIEADQKEMQALLDSDDALKTAVTENKRLRAEVRALKLRIDGLMNEKNESIKLTNSWRRKYEALEKKSKAAA